MEAPNADITLLLAWLLRTTLQGSLLICLIMLLRCTLGKQSLGKWLFCLWLILLVRLSLPWAPPSGLSLYNVVPARHWPEPAPEVVLIETGGDVRRVQEPLESERVEEVSESPPGRSTDEVSEGELSSSSSFDLGAGLFAIWVGGAILLAAYVLVRNLQLWLVIRRERPVTSQEILDLLEDGKMEMGVRTLVGVIVTDQVKTPALFGFVRPRLLLPQGTIETLSLDELRHVFLHELAHLKRRDIYVGWWIALLQVLHWFNPLVWLALRRVRADQEIACDALVLSHLGSGEPPEYGATMLRLLERFSQPQYLPSVAGLLEDASQIERRITMIARHKIHSRRTGVVGGMALVVLAAVTLTNAQTRFGALDEKVPPGLQKNLMVYYSFDRDGGTRAVDTSGMDFHGVVLGAEYTDDGYSGGAMYFDGEDDAVRITPQLSLKMFTVAAWVRTETTSMNNRRIFMLDQGRQYFAFETNSQGGTALGIAGGSHDGAVGVTEYEWRLGPGQWTHVAVTFTGTEVRLYRDGVRTETGLVSEERLTGTAYIGGVDTHNGRYWCGHIDELAVFNRALTDSEVGQLHEMAGEQVERQPTMRSVEGGAGPIAMWRFDGDARDSVGDRHGVVHGATPTAGVSGQAYAFDGQDDHVVIRNVQLHSFSVAAWVRTETTSINNRQIFVLTNGVRGYSLQGNVGGGVGVDVAAEGEVNEYHWKFAVGQWTHLVLAHDGKMFRIFKDGVLTQEGSLSTEGVRGTVYIGGSDHMDRGYWNGAIDEVVVWDRPLSQSEVKRLFDSYPLGSERTALSRVLQPNDFGGRWLGMATDKPGDGNSRDGLALELETDAANRVTGLAAGDFVDSETQRIENGRIQGGRLEFEIRHRTGVRMRIWLELRDGTLQGEGLPIDSDEDRCDIRLERAERRPTRPTGRPRERL